MIWTSCTFVSVSLWRCHVFPKKICYLLVKFYEHGLFLVKFICMTCVLYMVLAYDIYRSFKKAIFNAKHEYNSQLMWGCMGCFYFKSYNNFIHGYVRQRLDNLVINFYKDLSCPFRCLKCLKSYNTSSCSNIFRNYRNVIYTDTYI